MGGEVTARELIAALEALPVAEKDLPVVWSGAEGERYEVTRLTRDEVWNLYGPNRPVIQLDGTNY